MTYRDLETHLAERLQANAKLRRAGYVATQLMAGELAIERRGHVKGIWRASDGMLDWIPAGYSAPLHRVADIDAAERQTLLALGLAD
jgi:hypothetical protein